MKLDTKYETGVVWQDFQHKQLIDLFNKLKTAKIDENDKNLYRYSIAFLAMYVNHHFSLEEEYMVKYNYPELKAHKKEHKEFVAKIKTFRVENKEYSPKGSNGLLMQMGEWILDHILLDDQKLGKHILRFESPKES